MKRSIFPASALGWWATVVGCLAVALGLLLPFSVRWLARSLGGALGAPVGFNSVFLAVILAVAAVVLGTMALRRGERSWVALAALAGASVAGGFWMLFALGHLFWPD